MSVVGGGGRNGCTHIVEKEPVGYSSPSEVFVFPGLLLKVIHQLDLSGQDLRNLQALNLAGVDAELRWDETLHSRCVCSISNILLLRANSR